MSFALLKDFKDKIQTIKITKNENKTESYYYNGLDSLCARLREKQHHDILLWRQIICVPCVNMQILSWLFFTFLTIISISNVLVPKGET